MLTGPNLHRSLDPFPRGSLELIPAVIGAGAPDPRTRSAAAALQGRRWAASLEPVVHWGRAVVARGEVRQGRDATLRDATLRGRAPLSTDPARRQAIVADFSARLAHRVSQCLLTNRTPLVIGGDHSCAIGTWSGVARHLQGPDRLGLLWIDAHLDAHTPRSSDSKMPHGMPLAALLGEGPPALTCLAGGAPVLRADRVVVLGARSWEPAEARRLQRLGVRVMTADEVRARGLSVCMAEALRRVQGADQGAQHQRQAETGIRHEHVRKDGGTEQNQRQGDDEAGEKEKRDAHAVSVPSVQRRAHRRGERSGVHGERRAVLRPDLPVLRCRP